MPPPSPPSVGAEAPRAAEPADGNVTVGSHGGAVIISGTERNGTAERTVIGQLME